ncbi:FMN-dependent NADH-azoreductase [Phenylobacterium aquaticum]|uniref:FMN-dependent NADH-azoreductase n=1 Tax=Phenylobacterium aquaticum TaxID=1763816 RepID=UPI001F5CBD28|nr:FMN-dependent NADH-azoreductase [Phenylobacterium aquaticum]MCI3133630.1 FMN-dependent NADH-azoreductase [Phenylobacterium aquaticum]
MQILHLDSSILGDASASHRLTAAIVRDLLRGAPDAKLVRRDLVANPIPHLTGDIAAGFRALGERRFDAATLAEHACSEALVTEFLASDVIVVGAPMYNFSVSSQLKAWLDRIAQVGRTFRYTEQGPVGLSAGRRVIIASTRGGLYSAGPGAAMDFQESYLQAFFRFLGVEAVQVIRAEKLSRGPDASREAMDAAQAQIAEIVARTLAA